MSLEESSPERTSRSGAAASLISMKLRRAASVPPATGKAGDLTQQLQPAPSKAAPPITVRPEPPPSDRMPWTDTPARPLVPAPRPAWLDDTSGLDEPASDIVARNEAPAVLAPVLPAAAPEVELRAPRENAPSAPRPFVDWQSDDALIDYWDGLRGDRDLPFFAHLDRSRIAISWPDSLMVSFGGGNTEIPQITRLSRLAGEVEYTSMVTEWILACSRQAAQLGAAMEREQEFPSQRGIRGYRMLLLPFASPLGESDHILCHLSAAA